MSPTNAQLRQFMVDYFDPEELDTLCFDHFPDFHQNLGDGVKPNQLAKEIILYCDRRGRRDELLTLLRRERPSLWKEMLRTNAGEPMSLQVPDPEQSVRSSAEDIDSIRFFHQSTSIEFIRIPAGPFLYGVTGSAKAVTLPEFWIGRYPVTNAQYKRFLVANPDHPVPYSSSKYAQPYNWDKRRRVHPHDKEHFPVVLVSHHDAVAFCRWAGLRLPTEQEWQKAARGPQDDRPWPWGYDWQNNICNTTESLIAGTTVVYRHSPEGDSPYGCADMAGNVCEWTSTHSGDNDVPGVLCGGSWDGDLRDARVESRVYDSLDGKLDYYGFRVAGPAESDPLK